MNQSYYKIKKYIEAIPMFKIAIVFAKHKGDHFYETYYTMQDDCLQTIALACLESGNERSLNRNLSRHLYYLYSRTRHVYPQRVIRERRRYWRTKPQEKQRCYNCGVQKLEYMRKHFIEGKKLCGACYMRIRREDKRRNR
jgi:hypothetical protein